jgi:transketolase C-terminal domain/subunit
MEVVPQTAPAKAPIHGPKTQAMMATGIPIRVMVKAGVEMVPSGVKPKINMMATIKPITAKA